MYHQVQCLRYLGGTQSLVNYGFFKLWPVYYEFMSGPSALSTVWIGHVLTTCFLPAPYSNNFCPALVDCCSALLYQVHMYSTQLSAQVSAESALLYGYPPAAQERRLEQR